MTDALTPEHQRLADDASRKTYWKRWGPYVSERQWGTVREDYSENGTAWEYFPHDHARSRAYRWGEDGLFGISDNHQRLCFSLALWNEKDPILKERLFGLTGNQGNHGEDVKEYYFYLDSTPTHSYMKALYKYPHAAYPYQHLIDENARRTRQDPEYELVHTGIFNEQRYFDVRVEYAKGSEEDVLIKLSVTNRGPDPAPIHVLPQLWFRNTWSWDRSKPKPSLHLASAAANGVPFSETESAIFVDHPEMGPRWLIGPHSTEMLFTENETNNQRLFKTSNASSCVKDAFHDYLINGQSQAVHPGHQGTKAAPHYSRTLASGETWTINLRLTKTPSSNGNLTEAFDALFARRRREADEFYEQVIDAKLSDDERSVQRQAMAGMLWSKQYYSYIVREWLDGDPAMPTPPAARHLGRNKNWEHVYCDDVLSMPDKWEYPWFAAWDLGFHCVALATVDADFAKRQLELLGREWYMHPNGQIPAYEWAFGDVNPPVQAWAAWRVYQIDRKNSGTGDTMFLERVFQKLLMNFTWWVNRKDTEGRNIFQGGFLGLDNIGVFDRNQPMPDGTFIEQSDGTSWMAMYSLNLMKIATELAHHSIAYEDIASKFFEHFLYISDAMRSKMADDSLWDDADGFFYDSLHLSNGQHERLRVRSCVGLIPLFAVETLEVGAIKSLPDFERRINWFMTNRPDLAQAATCGGKAGASQRRLLSIVDPDMLKKILVKMLDETEFLSDHGIRSVSKYHQGHPYSLMFNGAKHTIDYEPAESTSGLFGGNSNWRGPIWMPINFLLIESLQKFHHYLGNDFKVECPTGSGKWMTLADVAEELSRRLVSLFTRGSNGQRPVFGGETLFQTDPQWKDHLLFYEYFHGDNGAGIGASHQTGWTGLVAKLIQQISQRPAAGEKN